MLCLTRQTEPAAEAAAAKMIVEYKAQCADAWTPCTANLQKRIIDLDEVINIHLEGQRFHMYQLVGGTLEAGDLTYKHHNEGTPKYNGAPRVVFRVAPMKIVQLRVTEGGDEWTISASNPLTGEFLFDLNVGPQTCWSKLVLDIRNGFDVRFNGPLKVIGMDDRVLNYHGKTSVKTIFTAPPGHSTKKIKTMFNIE